MRPDQPITWEIPSRGGQRMFSLTMPRIITPGEFSLLLAWLECCRPGLVDDENAYGEEASKRDGVMMFKNQIVILCSPAETAAVREYLNEKKIPHERYGGQSYMVPRMLTPREKRDLAALKERVE